MLLCYLVALVHLLGQIWSRCACLWQLSTSPWSCLCILVVVNDSETHTHTDTFVCRRTHTHIHMHTHTHTHTHTQQQQQQQQQPFYGSMDFVQDNPGEPVPEATFTHSHLSWSSIVPYLLHPSTTIHGILPVQSTHLTIFLHNLSPSSLWSTNKQCQSTEVE